MWAEWEPCGNEKVCVYKGLYRGSHIPTYISVTETYIILYMYIGLPHTRTINI